MTESLMPESAEPESAESESAESESAAAALADLDEPSPVSWLERIMRPAPLIGLSVMLSFAAWAIGNFLKDDAVDFSATPTWGTLVYLCWIAAAIAAAHVGFVIVRAPASGGVPASGGAPASTAAPASTEAQTPAVLVRALHTALLVTASAGIGWVVGIWYRDGLDVIGLIADNQANLLRYAIPYAAGPSTLRYAAIPATALAIRNIFLFRWHRNPSRNRLVDVLSFLALAVVAIPSSRLSVLMALVTAAGLLCYFDNRAPSARRVIVVIVLTMVALAGLNYSRNGGYYRELGVSDPASMLVYQSVSYLGAAFEGGSVAGDVLLGRTEATPVWGIGHALDPFVPSFVPGVDANPLDGISIHEISTIDPSLTTNSMFAETTLGFGIASMLLSLVAIFGGAALVGGLLRRRTLARVLAAGPLLYAFAEVWRLNLFNDGVMIFCLGSPLLLAALIGRWNQWRPLRGSRPSDTGTPTTRTSAPSTDEPTPIPDH